MPEIRDLVREFRRRAGPARARPRAARRSPVAACLVLAVVLGASLLSGCASSKGSTVASTTTSPIAAKTDAVSGGSEATPVAVGTGSFDDTQGLTGDTPCEKSGPPSSPEQLNPDDAGHEHRGPVPQQALDLQTFLALQAQQKEAEAAVERYPTVATATAAGFYESTVFLPCIGAHYTNPAYVMGFDPAHPAELLYDGTTPDAHIIGLSYLVYHAGGPPDGFAGPNDHWHQHSFNGGLCMKGGLVIGNETLSDQQCQAKGGYKDPLTNMWMLHDWIVPGYACGWGVFAPECPELGGKVAQSAWTK